MNHGIDTEALIFERKKLRKALQAMDTLLLNLGVDVAALDDDNFGGRVSLASAIRMIASDKRDGITKDVMLDELSRSFPHLQANPQSVAAALVRLSQGDEPFLFVNKRGAGNQPTVYTVEPPKIVTLTPTQMQALFAPERTTGSGGMQSLYKRIRQEADLATGRVVLSAHLKQAMRHYYFHYGTGGWQNTLKQIFGEHAPEIFTNHGTAEG